MFLMSASIVVCENVLFSNRRASQKLFSLNRSSKLLVSLTRRRRQLCGIIASAKNGHSRKRKWWQKFLLDDDGNWFGLKEEDMLEDPESSSEKELSEGEKFEAWKRRAEAISELREAQEDMRNAENRKWEDWLVEGPGDVNSSSWDQNWGNGAGESREDLEDNIDVLKPEKGLVESVRDLVLGQEDDELLYEDRVFRYVKTVPLAAEMLDVRKHQKLEMVKALKFERARYRFEVEIGKSPPLSDEEVWMELRHKALEMRDEWRLENRRAFANIWSDMVFGVSLFILLYFNQSKVALLKFTGYKIINNVSDTGKAFLIILITDIFLGYHSESGWQTLLEVIVEHYGFEVDRSAITIFVCIIPVIVDACVKLWLFKFLPRLSPRVSNIFREMTRH